MKLTPYLESILRSGDGAGIFDAFAFIFSRVEKNLLAADQIDNEELVAVPAGGEVADCTSARRRGVSAGSASAPLSADATRRILSCILLLVASGAKTVAAAGALTVL